MSGNENKYSFMKEAFASASRNTRADMLFQAGVEFIYAFLGQAKDAGSISRYFQQQGKEHPTLPRAMFYIVGVDDEWRYQHTKRGGKRISQERSLVDYYMHAEIKQDQTMTISFTTSAHAHVAKKMGWRNGVQELNVADEKGLSSSKANSFVSTLADFLSRHAINLNEQGERRRRTMKTNDIDPAP